MADTKATFDKTLHPPTAVMTAAHRFSGTHAVRIEATDVSTLVWLSPRAPDAASALDDLHNAVLDETLRDLVRARTTTLHDVLVKAAFSPVTGAAQ